jgi:hypothetical protein
MQMPFTSADLAAVEAAIKEIVAGKHEIQVDLGGTIRVYQASKIQELMDLREIIRQEIAAAAAAADPNAARRPRMFRTNHSKGL